jgi:hypothetical protein
MTVISEARVAANRRNAARSRGPTSDAGKAEARRNALKHGLAGRGTVLPEEMQRKYQTRLDSWSLLYHPAPGPQTWVFEQMVRASVAIQTCQTEQQARIAYLAQRARDYWDEDQARPRRPRRWPCG